MLAGSASTTASQVAKMQKPMLCELQRFPRSSTPMTPTCRRVTSASATCRTCRCFVRRAASATRTVGLWSRTSGTAKPARLRHIASLAVAVIRPPTLRRRRMPWRCESARRSATTRCWIMRKSWPTPAMRQPVARWPQAPLPGTSFHRPSARTRRTTRRQRMAPVPSAAALPSGTAMGTAATSAARMATSPHSSWTRIRRLAWGSESRCLTC
mmetsp:Transcript_55817/g.161663  ORF Transcript_55817/g.161663 Transcript_55817/m.161663 type:complete len:212 (-) Transcript_55817:359-994(-)